MNTENISETAAIEKQQETLLNHYLKQKSTPMPFLGAKWRLLNDLADMIAAEKKTHRWISLNEVMDIAREHKLSHLGREIDFFDLKDVLAKGFRMGEKILLGPYEFWHRQEDVLKNERAFVEDQYWLEIDRVKMREYRSFLYALKADCQRNQGAGNCETEERDQVKSASGPHPASNEQTDLFLS